MGDTVLTSASPQPQHSVLRMQRMRTSAWLLALLLLAAVAGPAAAFWGDADSDGDGMNDAADDDNDGLLDNVDNDDDGDGIKDEDEDYDGDGLANKNDPDDDGDGLHDSQEDDDGDGVINAKDAD